MGIVERSEVLGIYDGGRVFCSECLDEEDMNIKNIITQDDIEKREEFYFCDVCGEGL